MNPLHRLSHQIKALVGRCVLAALRDSDLQGAQVTVLDGEVREAEHFQPYGFTSSPFPGAEGVVVFPMGDRSHALVVVMDDRRYRLKGLEAGEVALYTDEGTRIVLRRGGRVEVRADEFDAVVTGEGNLSAGGNVTVESTGGNVAVEAAGDVDVQASLSVTIEGGTEVTIKGITVKIDAQSIEAALGATAKLMTDAMIDAYNNHKHFTYAPDETSIPIEGILSPVLHTTTKLKGS